MMSVVRESSTEATTCMDQKETSSGIVVLVRWSVHKDAFFTSDYINRMAKMGYSSLGLGLSSLRTANDGGGFLLSPQSSFSW